MIGIVEEMWEGVNERVIFFVPSFSVVNGRMWTSLLTAHVTSFSTPKELLDGLSIDFPVGKKMGVIVGWRRLCANGGDKGEPNSQDPNFGGRDSGRDEAVGVPYEADLSLAFEKDCKPVDRSGNR